MAQAEPGLPAAQIARRERLLGASAGTATPPAGNDTPPAGTATPPAGNDTPPAGTATPPAGNDTPPAGDQVTISREELNRLQANADRGEANARAAARAAQDLEELQHRLTELETAAKGNGVATPAAPGQPAPAALSVDVGDTTISADEVKEYGESEAFIVKVARREFKALLDKILPGIEQKLTEVSSQANSTVGTVRSIKEQSFVGTVKAKIADFDKIVSHSNWTDYLEARRPGTRYTNKQVLHDAHIHSDLQSMEELFSDFRTRYIGASGTGGGYAGAEGTGGGAPNTEGNGTPNKLPISVRNKASEDYRKGRIDWNALQVIKAKYDAAEAANNVDYNS